MKQNGVSDDALRLSLFPYSLMHHAIAWYDRLPRNSIHSFDDMMRKFLSKYFPPSMVTKLRNEITKFEQKPHESLFEAWERYKLSIDRCPNHNMLLVNQIDTFYNGLTLSHRDTINAAAGGIFMQKTPKECYKLIENMTAHHNHWDTSTSRDETSRNISSTTTTESPEVVRQLEMMNKNFVEMIRQIQTIKSVDTKCETCGGPHSFTECPAADGYTQEAVYATTGNHNLRGNSYKPQGDRNLLSYRSNNYLGPPGFNQPNVQNNQNRYNQNQGNFQAPNYQAPNNQGRGQNFNQGNNNYQAQVRPLNELTNYIKSNEATLRAMQTHMTNMKTELQNEFKSTIDARTNKIENQNNQIMNILTNMQNKNSLGSGSLPSNTVANPRDPILEPEVASKPKPKPSIPYPSRLSDQKLHEKANNHMLKLLQIFQRLHFDISFADALLHMPKFASTFKSLLSNKEKLFELANTPLNENCSVVLLKKLPEKLGYPGKFLIPCDFPKLDECLALADLGASINLMPLFVWKQLSLSELTSTRHDTRTHRPIDPSPTLPPLKNDDLKQVDVTRTKPSIEEPPELELKDLPSHLEYAFLEGTDKLPVIISKELKEEEKAALLKVLKSHKQAIAWKISAIKGIDPNFCTHKILMENDFKPAVQHQRRVNPKIHEVIKKEVIKLLDA
ncbi:reverse transcriptase domain-containing protein [Tanacetum coccineum]